MGKKDLKNNLPYKIYRKLNDILYKKLSSQKYFLYMFSTYRHYRFKKNRVDNYIGNSFYLTLEPNRGAGIGHQMGNWLAGFCLAKKLGVHYAYSRFPAAAWDDFLGFGENEISTEELLARGYRRKNLPGFNADDEESIKVIRNIIASYSGKKIIFYLALDQFYRDIQEGEEFIKGKFAHSIVRYEDRVIYDNSVINIAVHIRRGDIVVGQITHEQGLTKRWINSDYYVKLIEEVVSCIPEGAAYQIYIFSQGKQEDFPEFNHLAHISFCLDMSALDSFLHMVRADVLLTSKSSFSYKPALLSDGIKICPEHFWHGYPKEKKWFLADEESGRLNTRQLEEIRRLINESISSHTCV